jgi:uncharacterized protein YutE (UPF0331/DUF86 family)
VSPIDKGIIRRKLAIIIENLNALQPIETMPGEDYIDDIYKRKAAERLNIHIIVQTGNNAPDDYYESFIRAGQLSILSPGLAEKLAPSAGLRNRLVHEYDLIENTMVLDAVRKAGDLFPHYVKDIENYLAKND